jgi:hypothetical protein
LILNRRPSIDNASIPSAYAYSDGRLYFGEAAIARHSAAPAQTVLDTSPKSWFFCDKLDQIDTRIPECEVTRFEAIAGLVAISASKALAEGRKHVRTGQMMFRIAHPIWGSYGKSSVYTRYDILVTLATGDLGSSLDWTVPVAEFRDWCRSSLDRHRGKPDRPIPDAEEPVAAAMELMGAPQPNRRNPVLVVDIGAGTTDFAVFQHVLPDRTSRKTRKLYQLGDPLSVQSAGDALDRILLQIAAEGLATRAGNELKSFEGQLRQNKERLFRESSLALPGSRELQLDTFESHGSVRQFAATLKEATRTMVASAPIPRGSGAHQNDQLGVIYAGGGGSIPFIRSAVERGIRSADPRLTPFLYEYSRPDGYAVTASYERMAVAMGGTRPKDEWPQGLTRAASYPGLG